MKRELVISNVAFSDAGVEIQYMVIPDDVRSEGHVVMSRSAAISYQGPGTLGSASLDLRTSVEGLISQLLERFDELPMYDPSTTEKPPTLARLVAEGDDDDDVGMGDGR